MKKKSTYQVTSHLIGFFLLLSVFLSAHDFASASSVTVGSQISGSFGDATGHSAQSHLVYAANSGVWWLFTLTSAADSSGGNNHVVKAYRASGPDLATATWTLSSNSPGATPQNNNIAFMGSGRALSVAYINNAPFDVIHAEIAIAADGQDGTVAHIRARLTSDSINWETWNYHVEPAAFWTIPRAGALGVSTGKFIHSANPILQQEVDANVRKSTNADTGSSWVSGFGPVSVTDNSMQHENNSFAFAPLANNRMLAVYDNGGGISTCYPSCGNGPAEPSLTNLGYRRSNADGSWPAVSIGTQGRGDGFVFDADATINQNDWTMVSLDITKKYVFRKKSSGNGVDGASYDASSNTWSSMAVPPPLFGTGQAFKSGAGLFGATDGSGIWLFAINTDSSNSILYSKFDGSSWTSWTAVPGTSSGSNTRNYISGYPMVASGQIGLIWIEGSGEYNTVTTSLTASGTVPTSDTTPPITSASPQGGTFTNSQTVTLSANESATIYYTTNGSNPTTTSNVYSSPISISSTTTLKYFAKDTAGNSESIKTQTYTITKTYSLSDVVTLISNWLKVGTVSDVNGDNVVNARDLGVMMSSWN